MKANTIGKIFDYKNNSFTIVGLVCSLLIIYFHCYPIYYGTLNPRHDWITLNVLRGINIGTFVVPVFFVTSGFLVTFSLMKSKSSVDYIIKRVKRIIPPLFLVLLGTILFVAPFVSDLGWKILISPGVYLHYIGDNVLFIKNNVHSIADVFSCNPYPDIVNGSIWTLKHQFLLYIVALVIYKLGILNNKKCLVYCLYFHF